MYKYRYILFGLVLLLIPGVAFAHTDSDLHNALGIFGHPLAVGILAVVLVGVIFAMRYHSKNKNSDDIV
ncbi:MAG: hypothetical protein COU32_03170 [Candidatus Magasanikbacteria bacterium CG10_big_fil_rev_8_21_14_0_10_42_10]|uniref:Uncharacterized protein n=2 Tax=Candidatus Magasanikiibacteriota TaxID=1752731 RepID=A0A2H0TVS8_9BACT|nr:MAG: hypothetical protein COU32_03170 [Candidatus Magasanikbacteria bacterium CG10_big_fil_rev_8_21_14_0_10_42_10]PIZ93201.1 MAG: hypothetical protein COX82_03095 [Candidatus Magasanikbacteria bacterium CG_4_10_14_0_2_um_filter_41_10]